MFHTLPYAFFNAQSTVHYLPDSHPGALSLLIDFQYRTLRNLIFPVSLPS